MAETQTWIRRDPQTRSLLRRTADEYTLEVIANGTNDRGARCIPKTEALRCIDRYGFKLVTVRQQRRCAHPDDRIVAELVEGTVHHLVRECPDCGATHTSTTDERIDPGELDDLGEEVRA